MTPTDRRDFAASREYHICRDPFDGPDGPRWYWASLARESVTTPKERGFLDLASGRWRWWDEATMHPWEAGPWHELAGDVKTPPVATSAASPVIELVPEELHTPFTRECVAAGLSWESGQSLPQLLIDGRDLGNRFLRWQGRRYLAFSSTRRLILWEPGGRWEMRTIEELTGSPVSATTTPPIDTPAIDPLPASAPVPTRPLMTFGVPVQMTGAVKQRRLF